ncbi:MAG: tRNA lysidine(34) synthetase TilS [Pyrinomonadaceae bacterium]
MPIIGESVIVAVSGGADSTALILALMDLKKRKKLDLEFIVAHFNHKLRGKESDADEKFVKKIAEAGGLEFISTAGGLKGASDLEQQARNERYAFLAKLSKGRGAGVVLTAHTLNDQAETFLLNLVRGSGIDGLRAMPAIRLLDSQKSVTRLARPLLRWAKREDTEQFCLEQGVKFRQDRMNFDPKFTRVRLRRSILPELAKINPKIVETLAKTAGILQSLDHLPEKDGACSEFLDLSTLKPLSENDLNSTLREWISKNRGNSRGLELKHIEAVGRLVNSRKSGRIVELPGGDSVIKSGGRLAFRHIKLEY